MEIKIRNFNLAKYMQEGGPAPEAEAPAPLEAAPQEAAPQDPQAQLLAACQQALDSQDCQIAMQVCAAIIQMMGGAAPAEAAAPEGQAPVFKRGGKFSRWAPKN